MRIIAEAEVKPTENPDKVAKAITNLFAGPLTGRQEGERVFLRLESSNVSSLERFRMIIQRDRIRAAAGAVMRKASSADGIQVFLNKQVAFVSHVSFCEPEGESPLGPIRLSIETGDPFTLVNWITGGIVERERRHGNSQPSIRVELDSKPVEDL